MATCEAPLLEVRNIAKSYGKGKKAKEVLRDVSFTLNEGEVLGIIGESGCGKSVLLNLISCLEPLSSGRLLFKGEDYTGRKPASVCRWFQVIFQDSEAAFDPKITVRESMRENLRLLCGNVADADRRIEEMVCMMGLDPKQRTDILVSFRGPGAANVYSPRPGNRAQYALCDEITSALDVRSGYDIAVSLSASQEAALQ